MVPFPWYRYHFTTEELGCQEIDLLRVHFPLVCPGYLFRPSEFGRRNCLSMINQPTLDLTSTLDHI
jgi:hypothetical protein